MVRTIAGALFILAICFLARGPLLVARSPSPAADSTPRFDKNGRLDGMHPDSSRVGPPARASAPDSAPSRRSRSKQTSAVPEAFVRNPLAFLSRAPVDSLVLLKGIGPVLAERIAVARSGKGPFTSWDDFLSVQGIGPKKVQMLKEQARAAE